MKAARGTLPTSAPSAQLAQLGTHARKSLGQHFLRSEGVLERILKAAQVGGDDVLIEIGPGLGALTRHLVATGRPVVAVEKDALLGPALRAALGEPPNLTVIQSDALDLDYGQLPGDASTRRVVANLPYNVATPLLFRLVERPAPVRDLLVMVQKEVAERIVAAAGADAYGGLSVMMGFWARSRMVFTVPPGAFHPPPKVMSAILHLSPLPEPPFDPGDVGRLARVVGAAFQGRRKTLRNALSLGGWSREKIEEALTQARVDGGLRGEVLTLEQFCTLSRALG